LEPRYMEFDHMSKHDMRDLCMSNVYTHTDIYTYIISGFWIEELET